MKYHITWNTSSDNHSVLFDTYWKAEARMRALIELGIAFTLVAK